MIFERIPPTWHVAWIGGSPCAGKSTITSMLAGRYDCAEYHCDDHFDRHGDQLAARSPTFSAIARRSIEERLRLDIDLQVSDEITAYREEFPLILDDIAALNQTRIIAEAAALLPGLLFDLNVPPDRAIWLVPTEQFQRNQYSQRPWAWDLLRATSNPELLFDRWMRRDAQFGRIVRAQAESLGYSTIVVDGSRTLEDIAADVAFRLGLSGIDASGPPSIIDATRQQMED